MIKRWLLVVAGALVVVVLTAGIALAARPARAPTFDDAAAACAAAHASPAMRQAHAQLPAHTRAQMERMHAQMQPLMDQMMRSATHR